MKDINFEENHTEQDLNDLNRWHGRDLFRKIYSPNRYKDFKDDGPLGGDLGTHIHILSPAHSVGDMWLIGDRTQHSMRITNSVNYVERLVAVITLKHETELANMASYGGRRFSTAHLLEAAGYHFRGYFREGMEKSNFKSAAEVQTTLFRRQEELREIMEASGHQGAFASALDYILSYQPPSLDDLPPEPPVDSGFINGDIGASSTGKVKGVTSDVGPSSEEKKPTIPPDLLDLANKIIAAQSNLEVLGICAGTSGQELRKAYHHLCFKLSPDRNQSQPETILRMLTAAMQKVTGAYRDLTDD